MYKDLLRTCTAIVLLIKPFVGRRSVMGINSLSLLFFLFGFSPLGKVDRVQNPPKLPYIGQETSRESKKHTSEAR